MSQGKYVKTSLLMWSGECIVFDTACLDKQYIAQIVVGKSDNQPILWIQNIGRTIHLLCTIYAFTQGKPVNSIFVTPAVTPIKSLLEPFSNNPGVRAYLYHPDNYGLLVSFHQLTSSSTDLFTFSF